MQLESLTISLKQPYSKPGPSNPYEAKLSVNYNEHRMQVKLDPETCVRILELCGEEVAAAAQVQIADFVRGAIEASRNPMIEGAVS